MTVLYLDSSALAKLYLTENQVGRQLVLSALEAHDGRVAICAIGYAEVCSALARYAHEGRIDEAAYVRDMEIFRRDWEAVNVVNVLPKVSVLAGQLLKAHQGLRAMDALHLAAALEVREATDIQFLSFDAHLQTVAQRLMPDAFT